MPEAKSEKPMSTASLSQPMAEIFAHSADLWFATQAGLLADMDALTHAWLHRRREGLEAMRTALEQLTGCQGPAEMLQIQQEWLSGAFRRATDDISALNTTVSSLTKKATSDLEKAAGQVAKPLYAVGEEMLLAAGNKPNKSARPTASSEPN